MLAVAQSHICQLAIWRRVLPLRAALAVTLLLTCLQTSALAQAVTLTQWMDRSADRKKPNSAFTLPTQSTDAKDALDDFERMVKHEQWEQAFAALETVSKKAQTGFVDRNDGVLVPGTQLVRSLLADLPTAGKNAYRLFYDSQAMQLWDQAVGKAEAERLTKIVADHMISSVGDRAADRLGDLYFERGDFEQAVGAWRSILNYCPDSKIPKSQTLVKMATALARAHRWSEFRDVELEVRQRYADEQVEIGGRAIAATAHISSLAETADTADLSIRSTLPDDLELPSKKDPAWRFLLQTAIKASPNPVNQFAVVDAYGNQHRDFVVPAAADDARVYVNVFGVEMAFDVVTGKLLWRSGKLHTLNLQQARQMLAPERYSIDIRGEHTWSVSRDPKKANQRGPFILTVRNAASGKEVFSSLRSHSSWSILGAPKVAGGVAYVGAQKNGQGRDLSVLVLDAADGKLKKTIKIGTFAADQNQLYNDVASRPTFVMHNDRLYLDTHAGALAAIDPQSGNLEWAIMYESPAPQTGYYYNRAPLPCDASGPLVGGGLIFAKGMRSPRLLGIAGDGPTLVWNRPAADSAVLVAVDDQRVYLGGEELTAYSLKTQQLEWATKLPRAVTWSVPLVTANRLYQFTSRGVCEVDKATGEVVQIFRGDDLDSLGGSIFVAGGNLITVSNVGITAYKLDAPPAEARTP